MDIRTSPQAEAEAESIKANPETGEKTSRLVWGNGRRELGLDWEKRFENRAELEKSERRPRGVFRCAYMRSLV